MSVHETKPQHHPPPKQTHKQQRNKIQNQYVITQI